VKASDVMVSNVITVGPNTTVKEIADTLLTNRISAVPVIDERGAIVGIVSEGDLLHRVEAGTERAHSWWLDLLSGKEALAREFLKSHAVKASDVMTRRVISAGPDTQLGELASLLEKHRVKRVPIVKDGKLLGIVSRANLLQGLASLRGEVKPEVSVDDATVRERVLTALNKESWAIGSQINVIVRNGTVELWGIVGSPAEKDAIRVATELTPGVRAVNDHMTAKNLQYGL
jgi:CBS domain-containing protein